MTNPVIGIASRMQTPKGLRLHIGLFGRRNAGKSSLINALTNQKIAIVSDVPGTTTDPVEKACELAPIGPVVFIDTAGIDDVGELGGLRTERSLAVLGWVDVALIVCDAKALTESELELIGTVKSTATPAVVVLNKADTADSQALTATENQVRELGYEPVTVCASQKQNIDAVREAIVKLAQSAVDPDLPLLGDLVHPGDTRNREPDDRTSRGDLVHPGDTVMLVTPIDTGAPKGRLILPQVQAIREILDADAKCIVVRENRLAEALANEKEPPAFVVTDSQVVQSVVDQTPKEIPVTTFSIQMAYSKCDLVDMARGAAMIDFLRPGDKVMICETCSHHPQPDDIGRKKLPRWLAKKVGGELDVEVVVGKDFPVDLTPYKLILQCGGCVVTRRHMLTRLAQAKRQNVPMTNYGVAISHLQGVLERALELHPEAMKAFHEARETFSNRS